MYIKKKRIAIISCSAKMAQPFLVRVLPAANFRVFILSFFLNTPYYKGIESVF